MLRGATAHGHGVAGLLAPDSGKGVTGTVAATRSTAFSTLPASPMVHRPTLEVMPLVTP